MFVGGQAAKESTIIFGNPVAMAGKKRRTGIPAAIWALWFAFDT
jgi:hypothetical protein